MAQDYEIKVKVTGVDQATNQVDNLTDSMNDAGEAGSEAFGQLDAVLGGVPSKFKSAFGGVKKLAGGFKTLRAAIISTGIGALVIALTSLATFFTKTQRGAEMLEKAQAGLGAAFAVITDKVSAFGESLVGFFQNPIESIQNFAASIEQFVMGKVRQLIDGFGVLGKAVSALFAGDFDKAAQLAKDGFTKVGDSVLALNPATAILYQVADVVVNDLTPAIVTATKKAVALSDASIKLRENQRKLAVEFAEGRKEIKRYNLIAEDTTKGFDERIEAAQKAIDIERGLMDERLKNAEEELRIHNQRMALSESTEEDYEKRKDLEVALLNAQTESFEMQTTLNNKLNTLEQARTAEIEAAEKARTDALAKELQEREKLEAEAAKRQAEFDAKVEAARKQLKTEATAGTFSILKSLTEASEKDTEASAKKAFNRNKAISIAETLVNTYMAAQKAYASQIIPLDPTSVIRAQIAAGVAVATGLAKVAAIKSTQFTGGGGGGSAGGGGIGSAGGGGIQSVGVDVGSLVPNQQNNTPEPVRAYVVENEISNKQALNRELQIQTTL